VSPYGPEAFHVPSLQQGIHPQGPYGQTRSDSHQTERTARSSATHSSILEEQSPPFLLLLLYYFDLFFFGILCVFS
jgi:hypothetical protein